MKILFAGTPGYAVPSLRALYGLHPRHGLVGVITQPDRPCGRGRKEAHPPVKETALKLGLSPSQIVQTPVNAPSTLEGLEALKPDLVCVVAYGALFRRRVLQLAGGLWINAHGSLLPRHRGAAPIQSALLAGDAATGVTIMKVEPRLDSGPVLLRRECPIAPQDTAGSLHDTLSQLSADAFLEAIGLLEKGKAIWQAQDESQATYAGKLSKESGWVDWSHPTGYLNRFVRAMTPWPGAWTVLRSGIDGKPCRIRLGEVLPEGAVSRLLAETGKGAKEVGTVRIESQKLEESGAQAGVMGCLGVRCGDGGWLWVKSLQPEGGRLMGVREFICGAGRSLREGGGLCRAGKD
jgi:methionyl-tRNA formyltransferase